jgi:hypothetical protein
MEYSREHGGLSHLREHCAEVVNAGHGLYGSGRRNELTFGNLAYLILLIFVMGVFGGLLSALQTHNTNLTPKQEAPPAGVEVPTTARQLGLLLNMITGGIAAVLSWALYGPLAEANIFNLSEATYAMTLAGLGGAFFVGYSGSRWLSAEADRRTNSATITVAQLIPPDPQLVATIQAAEAPMDAFQIVKDRYEKEGSADFVR